MYLYIITPILGVLRNYVKYKQLDTLLFIRTPILYILLHILFQQASTYEILIYERWILFIYKTMYSVYNNDYIKNKEKYIQKYNLKYD